MSENVILTVLGVLVSALCITIVAPFFDTRNRIEDRETVCTINGYDSVADDNENFYCIGKGTSAQLIRVDGKYELR